MNDNHSILFTPWKVGGCEIKNRFIMAPMEGTNIIDCETHYEFNESCRQIYLDRAKSQVGLFVCGMVAVRSYYGNSWLYQQEDIFRGPVKSLMDELHAEGAKFFIQIGAGMGRSMAAIPALRDVYHDPVKKAGAKAYGMDVERFFLAPTAGLPNVWDPEIKTTEMTVEDIEAIIDGFGKAAKLAQECGVDGVEVHAIHEGYLLDQFSMALTNKRTDKYGGTLENRMRITMEIIKRIKEYCGQDYPVSVRYSVTSKIKGFNKPALPGEEYIEAGRGYEETGDTARLLEAAGADLLNADNGTYDSWFWAHPPVYMPLACNLPDAAYIKTQVHIPVACAGRLEDPDTAAEALQRGDIDAVCIGRQFLCDGEYVAKILNDDIEDIRPCIACHNGCFGMYRYKGLPAAYPDHTLGHCALNPLTREEDNRKLVPTEKPKHIAIIGGGVAGMEAARVSALRGHTVDVYEKTGELGGSFIAAAAPDFKERDKALLKWYAHQLDKLSNVTVHMNTAVTALSDIPADEYIVATGSTPKVISFGKDSDEAVVSAIDYLRGRKPVGENVVIIGGGLTGCEIAYDLALKGKKPVIVEMLDDILKVKNLCAANSNMLRAIIERYNIPVYVEAKAKAFENSQVTLEQGGSEITLPCDNVILSIGYNSAPLTTESDNVHVIGDAHGVGNLMNAIWTAYDTALTL